jgi:hypothetical protein
MGYDPKARTGVVVLANISTPAGVDDIGRHLLNASYPLQNLEAPVEHREITLDAKAFDRYTGVYQLDQYALLTLSRDADHFYAQLTGQPKLEIFPESERKFFLKSVDAQLTFAVDSQGAVTQVTLHQNARDMVGKRLNETEAKRAQDAIEANDAEIAKRFKAQAQSPGTEAALRNSIQGLQSGTLKYEIMSPQLADLTRQQLPQLKAAIGAFGALQSVTFKGVGPGGADIYEVKFEHANTEWRVILGADGKITGINFRAL